MLTVILTLSTALLALGADVSVPISSHWNGGFQGSACFNIMEEMHSWTVVLTFDQPISSLDVSI